MLVLVTKDISFRYTYTLSHMEFKLDISNTSDPSSQTVIYSPDCLYSLQKTPFIKLMNGTTVKIIELPYKYADNSIAIDVWKHVLDELIEDGSILSYQIVPETSPYSIFVEYPSSSFSSTPIG